VESFEDAEKGLNRAWVKGGVVNPEKGFYLSLYSVYSYDKHYFTVAWEQIML